MIGLLESLILHWRLLRVGRGDDVWALAFLVVFFMGFMKPVYFILFRWEIVFYLLVFIFWFLMALALHVPRSLFFDPQLNFNSAPTIVVYAISHKQPRFLPFFCFLFSFFCFAVELPTRNNQCSYYCYLQKENERLVPRMKRIERGLVSTRVSHLMKEKRRARGRIYKVGSDCKLYIPS